MDAAVPFSLVPSRDEAPAWLTRKEASKLLGELGCPISPGGLARLAVRDNTGGGPPFTRSRKRTVRYLAADLRAWAAHQIRRVG